MLTGVPYHLGIVVHDLDVTMGRYSSLLGLEGWQTRDVEIDTEERGRPLHVTQRIAYCPWGASYLELVQPVTGDSLAANFLREHGEAAYHVGYFHEDLETSPLPDKPIIRKVWTDGALRAIYLDTLSDLGLYVELVAGSGEKAFLEWIKGAGGGLEGSWLTSADRMVECPYGVHPMTTPFRTRSEHPWVE